MTTIEIVGSPLYQWEVGRQIRVTPSPGVRITAVQFAKLGDNEALSVAPSEPSGVIIADIPNILLQDNRSLVVYITDMSEDRIEAFTDKTFTIIGRPKPNDYVCTETEVLNYAYLDKRLNALEGEGLAKAVAAYLQENPVEAGATAEEAAQIEQNKTDIATLDRTKLAASELPNAVNEALAQAKASGAFDGKDGKDYVLTEADKQEIAQEAAGMVEPSTPDLTGYATEAYVDETAEALRGEIPVKQIEYLTDLPEFISTHPFILVSNTTHNPTDTTWTGTLLITRGYSNYGVYDFSAIDGAGACYRGAVSLRDNSINLNLVDSLESKATKEYVDEAVGNVDIPTTLPNPNALTFTGAATGTYDGSAPLTVNIPEGGGGTGGGSSGTWELIGEVTSDGAGDSGGIYVPIDFTQYKEIHVEAVDTIDGTLTYRLKYSGNTAWYAGETLTSIKRGEIVMHSVHTFNVSGELKNIAGYASGYAAGSDIQIFNTPRASMLASEFKFICLDANGTVVPEGATLKVWGCK